MLLFSLVRVCFYVNVFIDRVSNVIRNIMRLALRCCAALLTTQRASCGCVVVCLCVYSQADVSRGTGLII